MGRGRGRIGVLRECLAGTAGHFPGGSWSKTGKKRDAKDAKCTQRAQRNAIAPANMGITVSARLTGRGPRDVSAWRGRRRRVCFSYEQDQRDHESAEDAEDGDDVHVGEHRGLAVEIVVDEGLRSVHAAHAGGSAGARASGITAAAEGSLE